VVSEEDFFKSANQKQELPKVVMNKHGHHRQFLFLIGRFLKKSSPLKLFGQMNRNLVGSILGRFSITIAHIVPMQGELKKDNFEDILYRTKDISISQR
jgi:hypothetical protein